MRGLEYLPFGEVWIEDVDPATRYIPFRFTSKELDRETGLYYYGARYYEPKVSRWMSADPAGFALVDPNRGGYSVIEAANWYAYVSNNPVKYVDPTGMILIVIGSDQFVKQVKADLNTIRSKRRGRKLIEKLENSGKLHTIKESPTKGDNSTTPPGKYKMGGPGTGSTIWYDPKDKKGGRDENWNDARPPFVGLAHELGHAEALDEGTQSLNIGSGAEDTTPPSEINSMKRENQVRKEHGLPKRPFYTNNYP